MDEEKEKKISEGKLLFDPMFVQRPAMEWQDSKDGRFFGKAVVKKILFVLVLIISIGGSLFFSFNSISKPRFEFNELDDGTYKLAEFNGQKFDTVLNVDYLRDENGTADLTKPVSTVRKFTSSGNDTLQFVFIGKDVREIEKTAFFYCSTLNAVLVDDENPNYCDIDGVLYKIENGVPTEAVFCPQQHTRYMIALSLGEKEPSDADEANALAQKFLDSKYTEKIDKIANDESFSVGKVIEIPETVTVIDQLCFGYCNKLTSVKLPQGLKEIETMAFFKCDKLSEIELPDSLETIGSDAFSKCSALSYLFIPASVKEIGHHAFWECKKIEKVYMAAESLDGIKTGTDWIPQERKVFMKNRELVFGAERGVM